MRVERKVSGLGCRVSGARFRLKWRGFARLRGCDFTDSKRFGFADVKRCGLADLKRCGLAQVAMALQGGIGILHYNCTIEEQVHPITPLSRKARNLLSPERLSESSDHNLFDVSWYRVMVPGLQARETRGYETSLARFTSERARDLLSLAVSWYRVCEPASFHGLSFAKAPHFTVRVPMQTPRFSLSSRENAWSHGLLPERRSFL